MSKFGRTSFLLGAGVLGVGWRSVALAAPMAMPLPGPDLKADADMQRVLQNILAGNAPPLPEVEPRIARELPSFADALAATLTQEGKPTVETIGGLKHKVIDGPGGPLLLRMYFPKKMAATLPVVVYFHGGGWVIASLDTYDASARSLANGSGAIVVSVAYRQAPEHPFPAAADDAFAAYKWVVANTASFGGDAKRIAIAGESAGGNLAAVTTMQARDNGVQMPTHQLLVYPITNIAFDTASYDENATAAPLGKPAMQWFAKYYLKSESDATNPLVSVLRAKDFKKLSPATIINAQIDPLRDDGKLYAEKLQAAGVRVKRTLYSGVTHEFFGMGGAVAKAKLAMAEACEALEASFGKTI